MYDGQFDAGVRHGIGTLKFANGDVYNGHWDGDVKEGKGVMTWASIGASYDGDFARGVMHGQGTYTFPDGSEVTHEDARPCDRGRVLSKDFNRVEDRQRSRLPLDRGQPIAPD